jgi:hypothetical protein
MKLRMMPDLSWYHYLMIAVCLVLFPVVWRKVKP